MRVSPETPIDELIAMIETREKGFGYDAMKETGEGNTDGDGETKGTDSDVGSLTRTDSTRSVKKSKKKKKKPKTEYLYCGRKLVRGKGKLFGEYPWQTEVKKWSKPFVGVVWVCPNYIEPGFAKSRRRTKKGKSKK